jgi:hypothetical protein
MIPPFIMPVATIRQQYPNDTKERSATNKQQHDFNPVHFNPFALVACDNRDS